MAVASDGAEKLEDMIVRSAETTAEHVRAAKSAIGAVIFGQDMVVERALVTILSGGHALLVGVPGLAKTKLVETLGIVLGLDARRIQFTPDLMPSDILGAEVLEESPGGRRSFRFIAGPIFAQLLMADEINRASPRTQSALLQAMQEQHVTVAGARHDVPKPFHVLATQNPLEQEGTYPLPEAQLDRFLMEIDIGYPDRDAERRILFETTGAEETRPKRAMTADELTAAQRLGAPPTGRGIGGRRNPQARALGAPWAGRGRYRQAHRLGTEPASEPGAHARGARPRAARWSAGAFDRRRRRACRSRFEAPHGAHVCRPRRWRDHRSGDREAQDAHRMSDGRRSTSGHRGAEGNAAGDRGSPHARCHHAPPDPGGAPHRGNGDPRAAWAPPRRPGRELLAIPPLHLRRSGASRRLAPLRARRPSLCARAGVGSRAHGVDLAGPLALHGVRLRRSPPDTKLDRTLVVAFALAEVLVEGGERIGIPGLMRPTGSRNVIDKMAEAIMHDVGERASLPPSFSPSPLAEIVMLSDFWSPIGEVHATIAQLSATGAQGHAVQIVDPAEETFPYSGRVEFIEPEGAGEITAGRAETWRGDYEARIAAPPRRDQAGNRPAWLELRHPPHRPAGERSPARAARAHGRRGRGHRHQPLARDFPAREARMMGLPLAFASPLVLIGLLSLPVLWWLLRLIPPRPRRIHFPPTRLLFDIAPKEETPARTPWWLTLLRLALAALVIIAAAGPLWNPPVATSSGAASLALLIDDGWSAAASWEARLRTADDIIARAEADNRGVALVPLSETVRDISLEPPAAARVRLRQLKPKPHTIERTDAIANIARFVNATPDVALVWLSDGVDVGRGADFIDALARTLDKRPITVVEGGIQPAHALAAADHTAGALTVKVLRATTGPEESGIIRALDLKGLPLGETRFTFKAGERETEAEFTLPVEIRNDIARLEIASERSAGAVQLLDKRWRRRTIGVVSGATAETAQPLLASTYLPVARAQSVRRRAACRRRRAGRSGSPLPRPKCPHAHPRRRRQCRRRRARPPHALDRGRRRAGALRRPAARCLQRRPRAGQAAPRRPHPRRQPELGPATEAHGVRTREPVRRNAGSRVT